MVTTEYHFRDLIHTEDNNPSNNVITRGFESIIDTLGNLKYIIIGVLAVILIIR